MFERDQPVDGFLVIPLSWSLHEIAHRAKERTKNQTNRSAKKVAEAAITWTSWRRDFREDFLRVRLTIPSAFLVNASPTDFSLVLLLTLHLSCSLNFSIIHTSNIRDDSENEWFHSNTTTNTKDSKRSIVTIFI